MKRSISLVVSPRTVKLLLLAVIASAHTASATTLVVGNCKGSSPYQTIQSAIKAAPAGATVQVCPGFYPEQVKITQAVTLAGISANNRDDVQIAGPVSGLIPNTTDMNGFQVAANVLVSSASGPVNISNIFVAGGGSGITTCPPLLAGIFYQNSSGTVNRVQAWFPDQNHCGIGIWIEGGSSNPAVTVSNSFVAGYDEYGIKLETYNHLPAQLKANVSSNFVRGGFSGCSAGIAIDEGTTATVTSNVFENTYGLNSSCGTALLTLSNAVGSISSNTVHAFPTGIRVIADGVSITSNKLVEVSTGIELHTAVPAVKSNSITNSTLGIEFNCNANPNVLSNTINADAGIDLVPSGVKTTNKFFNVGNVRTGTC